MLIASADPEVVPELAKSVLLALATQIEALAVRVLALERQLMVASRLFLPLGLAHSLKSLVARNAGALSFASSPRSRSPPYRYCGFRIPKNSSAYALSENGL
jgi:hypothetical protein